MNSFVRTCFGRLIRDTFACRPYYIRATTREIASNHRLKAFFKNFRGNTTQIAILGKMGRSGDFDLQL